MKLIIFIIAPLLIAFSGCEEKPKAEAKVIVNHEAEVCGIKDPIENIEWLKELHKAYADAKYDAAQSKSPRSFADIFFVFVNDTSGENSVIIEHSWYGKGYSGYNCLGEEVIDGGDWDGNIKVKGTQLLQKDATRQSPCSTGPPCNDCAEFFQHNTLVDTLSQCYYTVY